MPINQKEEGSNKQIFYLNENPNKEEKNIVNINNNSNIYINNLENNQYFFPCLTNGVKCGNLCKDFSLENNNISVNYNQLSNNYSTQNNYFIYNYNNILYKDINNHSNNYRDNNNMYINNGNIDNNISFYLSQNDAKKRNNLMKYRTNNSNENKINIFFNSNDIQNIIKKNNFNNDCINHNGNINTFINSNDHNITNILNGEKNINYLNSLNQSNYFNCYNNLNNNHIFQTNKIENQNNNYIINKNNIRNIANKSDFIDFIKYINSLPMHLVNFLCTPKGTMEIQKKLEKSNIDYKLYLVNFLNKQGLSTMMKNTYGNYFFQQLIKKNEKSFVSLIISYISDNFIDISKDFSGTFSLQALLEEISSIEEEQKVLNCIKNYEMEMAFNKNATHVLQKIVLLFPDNHRLYLNEIILNHFIELCLDSNGICLIKIFIKTNTILDNKKRIHDNIINNFVTLAESPFGNYGIQYLMEIWNKDDLLDIKSQILENLYKLSLKQFSSNVIEKAIEIFDEENRIDIIKKLCFDENFLVILIKNKFGKFVLNKAIKYMKLDIKNKFEINLINGINNNIYKNKDKNKIKKLLLKLKNNKINKNDRFNDISSIFNTNYFYSNNNSSYL